MIETVKQREKREASEAITRKAQAAKHQAYLDRQKTKLSTEADVLPEKSQPATKVEPNPDAPLTVLTAKTLTKRIKDHLEGASALIIEAYEKEAWKLLGYESWIAYVQKEFDVSRGHAYRILNYAETIETLQPVSQGEKTPCERQTRPLEGLTKKDKRKAWQKAKKIAGNTSPTGMQVAAAVAEIKPAKAQEFKAEFENAIETQAMIQPPPPNITGGIGGVLPHVGTRQAEREAARFTPMLEILRKMHATAQKILESKKDMNPGYVTGKLAEAFATIGETL